MSFVSDDKTVTARKQYHCWFCDQRIEVGEKHVIRTGANEDGLWTMRMHPECRDAVHADRDFDYEGFEPGWFKRPMTAFDPVI